MANQVEYLFVGAFPVSVCSLRKSFSSPPGLFLTAEFCKLFACSRNKSFYLIRDLQRLSPSLQLTFSSSKQGSSTEQKRFSLMKSCVFFSLDHVLGISCITGCKYWLQFLPSKNCLLVYLDLWGIKFNSWSFLDMNAEMFQHRLLKNSPPSFAPWQAALGHISVRLVPTLSSWSPVCPTSVLTAVDLC